jgi:hypothetical protein
MQRVTVRGDEEAEEREEELNKMGRRMDAAS